MTSRSKARRHRGLHKPYRGSHGVPQHQYEEDDEYPDQTTLTYWRGVIEKPLFVYLIQAENGGPVKVGQAADPGKRVRELQCGNPYLLEIQYVVLAAVDTERLIHDMWHDEAHVRGEWYGHGYEDALLALARTAAYKQVEAHQAGVPLHQITDMATTLIAFPAVYRAAS